MSGDEGGLCPGCARQVKRTSCVLCGSGGASAHDANLLSSASLHDAFEEIALATDEATGKRHRNRNAIEAILKTYTPEEVNWSAVASLLGVSRQAVHQIKRRVMAPAIPSLQLALRLDAVPLHSHPVIPTRSVRSRTSQTTAVILAGGAGTRLRPLTLSRRKELIPLLNRPLLEYRLRNLGEHGITDVILACSQGAREIEQEFGDGAQLGLSLRYSYEDRPLGSGRAIKEAARGFGVTGTLVVCNGDILTNVDLAAMLRAHQENDAAISISLKRVDDPWHFGVVRMQDDLQISEFIEKPLPGDEPSNLINAGTWLWEPEVLDRIPDDDSAIRDGFAERFLFPAIIQDGHRVQGFIEDGVWVDVGSPERYLIATELLMASSPTVPSRQSGNATGVQYIGRSVIGERVQIGDGARIIGPSVIGDGCTIGSGAVIDRSVLWEDVSVGPGSQLVGSIAARAVVVGARASVIDSVLGDGARIGDDFHLDVGAKMQPGEVVGRTSARRHRSSQRV